MTSPVWRNDDLEGAVIGAFFLRVSTTDEK